MARGTAVTVLPLRQDLNVVGDDAITFDNVATGMWTTTQVAAFLGVSRSGLYDSLQRGDFSDVVIRVGTRTVWPGPALARMVGLTERSPGSTKEVIHESGNEPARTPG
jgi:hypothetical protein